MPSGAIDTFNRSFDIQSSNEASLPVALFLVGYIFGPILFGPMSEAYGRRPCFLSSFALYSAFTLACSFSTSWPALLAFRFLVGCGASAPQAVLGGMYSDIYPDLVLRGRAVMILGLTSNIGPLLGPVLAGYSSIKKWQTMFWINLGLVGLIWPMLFFLPGTYDASCPPNDEADGIARELSSCHRCSAGKAKSTVDRGRHTTSRADRGW